MANRASLWRLTLNRPRMSVDAQGVTTAREAGVSSGLMMSFSPILCISFLVARPDASCHSSTSPDNAGEQCTP